MVQAGGLHNTAVCDYIESVLTYYSSMRLMPLNARKNRRATTDSSRVSQASSSSPSLSSRGRRSLQSLLQAVGHLFQSFQEW